MLQLPGDKASDFEVESPDIGELEVSPIPLLFKNNKACLHVRPRAADTHTHTL